MSELITIIDNEPFTTSLALADGTGTQHKNILELIRKYADDLKQFGNTAFITRNSKSGGGRPTEVCQLNELQSTLIITYMKNTEIVRKFKMALVKGFYDAREKLRNGFNPTTLSKMDILKLAMDSEEEKQKLAKQIEHDAPKVEFATRHASAVGNFCLRDAAKQLGYPQMKFIRWLCMNNYIYKPVNTWMPYSEPIKRGFLEVKSKVIHMGDGTEKVAQQCRVTAKGLQHFEKRLIKAGEIAPVEVVA